jgi:superoxide dismutase, Fe-Mn family
MAFELPPLPYANDALEPYIDAMTMEIHHDRHHAAYLNNLNAALKGTEWENKKIEDILANVSSISPAVRNNGGGFYNHNLFWNIMGPKKGGAPSGELADAIKSTFGSFEDFKTQFADAGVKRFGSGWAWLVVKSDKTIAISSTPNQDNPLMDVAEVKGIPVLGCDVWEHAYYLKYQNKRPDYITNWWNVVNWDEVSRLYKGAM